MNPLRFIKNLFIHFLLRTTGTYIGAPPHPRGGNAPRADEDSGSLGARGGKHGAESGGRA